MVDEILRDRDGVLPEDQDPDEVIEGLGDGRMEGEYTAETLVSPSKSAGCGGSMAPDVFTTPARSHGPMTCPPRTSPS
jgi:hypothetical protein